MSAKHTPGPWHFNANLSGSENHRGYRVYGPGASGWALAEVRPVDEDGIEGGANARLIAAAPELMTELQKLTDNAEQAAFEEWLAIVRPSGDVEQVQSQWEASSAYEDFYEQWKGALAALAKATVGEQE